jgi:hypothetical protein
MQKLDYLIGLEDPSPYRIAVKEEGQRQRQRASRHGFLRRTRVQRLSGHPPEPAVSETAGTRRVDREDLDQQLKSLLGRVQRLEKALYTKTSLPDPALRKRFRFLVGQWRQESIRGSSFLGGRFMHPAYQQIIGLGQGVIPLILEELAREPDHWGWALTAITGENPISEDDAGDIEAMARSWLAWGLTRGLVIGNTEEGVQKFPKQLAESNADEPCSD